MVTVLGAATVPLCYFFAKEMEDRPGARSQARSERGSFSAWAVTPKKGGPRYRAYVARE